MHELVQAYYSRTYNECRRCLSVTGYTIQHATMPTAINYALLLATGRRHCMNSMLLYGMGCRTLDVLCQWTLDDTHSVSSLALCGRTAARAVRLICLTKPINRLLTPAPVLWYPTVTYTQGSTISITLFLSANHGGRHQFAICPSGVPNQDCFNNPANALRV